MFSVLLGMAFLQHGRCECRIESTCFICWRPSNFTAFCAFSAPVTWLCVTLWSFDLWGHSVCWPLCDWLICLCDNTSVCGRQSRFVIAAAFFFSVRSCHRRTLPSSRYTVGSPTQLAWPPTHSSLCESFFYVGISFSSWSSVLMRRSCKPTGRPPGCRSSLKIF